jgi:hypothetical protein
MLLTVFVTAIITAVATRSALSKAAELRDAMTPANIAAALWRQIMGGGRVGAVTQQLRLLTDGRTAGSRGAASAPPVAVSMPRAPAPAKPVRAAAASSADAEQAQQQFGVPLEGARDDIDGDAGVSFAPLAQPHAPQSNAQRVRRGRVLQDPVETAERVQERVALREVRCGGGHACMHACVHARADVRVSVRARVQAAGSGTLLSTAVMQAALLAKRVQEYVSGADIPIAPAVPPTATVVRPLGGASLPPPPPPPPAPAQRPPPQQWQ